jgi:predicted nicotinamide N-methyase
VGGNRNRVFGNDPRVIGDDAPCTIAGYGARCERITIADQTIALWGVDDLERYVDREALLRGDDPIEPPYWAHCWAGARVLAAHVPARPGRVVEIGCGLGLPGAVAAQQGGDVLFVDRVAAPLAFVRATLAANGLVARGLVVADVLRAPWRGAFDTVLAAEVLYDRATFATLAAALAELVTPAGMVLLADGHRIDTRAFYDEARAAGFDWTSQAVAVEEEGVRNTVTVAAMRRVI